MSLPSVHPAPSGPIRLPPPPAQTLRDVLAIFFFKKRVFLGVFLGVLFATIAVALLSPPRYQVTADLLVKPSLTKPFMVQAEANTYFEATVSLKDLNTVIFLLQSTEHLAQVVEKLGLAPMDDPRAVQAQVNALKAALKAEPLTESNVVRVTFTGRDPKQTTETLSAIVNNFVDFFIEINRVKGGLGFFENQTAFLQRRLAQLNQELEQVTKQEGIVDPQVQRLTLLELVRNLEQERMRLRAQLEEVRAKFSAFDEVQRRFDKEGGRGLVGLPKSATYDFPALIEMEKTLAQLTINLQRARNDYQPDSKPVRDAEMQLGNMRQQIRQYLRQIVEDLRVEEKSLLSALASVEKRIEEVQREAVRLTGKALAYEQLKLEKEVVSKQYSLYADKQEEARIREAKDEARFANVSIAAAPRLPNAPVFPRPTLMITLALLLGPIIAAGLAMAAYLSEQRIYSPADAAPLVPVLGTLEERPVPNFLEMGAGRSNAVMSPWPQEQNT